MWPLFSKRNSKVSNSDTEGVKAARQAIAAGSCNWVVFCRGVSCSSSHGSYSPLVFSHFDERPLNQSVKTLPALGCQACKLASHLGHGVVAALSNVDRSCHRWRCWLLIKLQIQEKSALDWKTKVTQQQGWNFFKSWKQRYLENKATYSYVVYLKRIVIKKPFFWRLLDASSLIGSRATTLFVRGEKRM